MQETMWQFFFEKNCIAPPTSPGLSPKNCIVFTMYVFPKNYKTCTAFCQAVYTMDGHFMHVAHGKNLF